MKQIIGWTIAALFVTSSSIAADFPHRADLNTRSKSVGLAQSTLPVLRRQAGPGMDIMGKLLLSRWSSSSATINTAGSYQAKQRGNGLHYVGDNGWVLKVHGDGTAVEYRNHAYRKAHLTSVTPGKHPTLADVDAWGRAFIANNLSGFISLGPSEQLVGDSVKYEILGGQSVDASLPPTTSVVSAIAIYSRVIGGVDVLGEGSKIAILFTMDGTPWGFSFDWPTYSVTPAQQQILPLSAIRQRHKGLVDVPSNLARDTEVRFECGYFDVGARYSGRDPSALIQGACISHRIFDTIGDSARYKADPTNGIIRVAKSTVIPIGATILTDKAWHEAAKLLGSSNGTNATALTNQTAPVSGN